MKFFQTKCQNCGGEILLHSFRIRQLGQKALRFSCPHCGTKYVLKHNVSTDKTVSAGIIGAAAGGLLGGGLGAILGATIGSALGASGTSAIEIQQAKQDVEK